MFGTISYWPSCCGSVDSFDPVRTRLVQDAARQTNLFGSEMVVCYYFCLVLFDRTADCGHNPAHLFICHRTNRLESRSKSTNRKYSKGAPNEQRRTKETGCNKRRRPCVGWGGVVRPTEDCRINLRWAREFFDRHGPRVSNTRCDPDLLQPDWEIANRCWSVTCLDGMCMS